MQKPPSPRPGDLVAIRRTRWRIVDVRSFDDCRVVTAQAAIQPITGIVRRFLSPFDVIEPIERLRRPQIVSRRSWGHAARAAIADAGPAARLVAARAASIDLLPFQLEPALAVVHGLALRLLLADEVGLGKTIQAGLVASELLARNSIERILVLTPAGLRDQWIGELSRRFGIGAERIDARTARRAAAALPIGVNPWLTVQAAVASIDYVKRPEVIPAVTAVPWDLVVVDEAHAVAADSDRRAAAHALACRAPYVLLLTATPHSGDRDLYAALCSVGAVDDTPLVVFRRTRSDVGLASRRRVHIVTVNANVAERRMHTQLLRYADAIRNDRRAARGADALLALGVLHKRMLSSAWSLAQSVDRRLQALAAAGAVDDGEQMLLPLGDPAGERTDADQPPPWPAALRLGDRERERRLLAALLAAARSAARDETKLRRLSTLLRRVREPAIVFTEYRDTLLHIRRGIARPTLVLHGGSSRDERGEAVRAFVSAPDAVLLATDAAAEGLNLHYRCRTVINLELPWNPSRLEQRIGRVDRIGQQRTVHAFHLVAAATGETAVLDRLRARIAAATSEIRAANPLSDTAHERAIARLVFAGTSPHEHDG